MAEIATTTLEFSKIIPDSFFETINEAQEQLKQLNHIAENLQQLGIKIDCSFDLNGFYSKVSF